MRRFAANNKKDLTIYGYAFDLIGCGCRVWTYDLQIMSATYYLEAYVEPIVKMGSLKFIFMFLDPWFSE